MSSPFVSTTVNFLAADELYQHEKPYILKFDPPLDFPRTNHKIEKRDLCIKDIRGQEQDFSLPKNGFALMPLNTKLSYDDFDDDTKVTTVHFKEVAEGLQKLLGAFRVQIFEHLVSNSKASGISSVLKCVKIRKRHVSFPMATGEQYSYNQPTTAAHIGTHLIIRDMGAC
jgi:hypothetical protein